MLASILTSLLEISGDHLGWLLAGAAVLLGLGAYGWRDVINLSWARIWALSSVAYRDALRKKVLWITPLAMLGVVIVSQLLNPIDEQDAIRQTTKFAFFATGLVVTLASIILTCTNLPKEIENKVIFTIVTKPTTRLEIVLGKVLGFARVSAAILAIMGLFTFGYLKVRAWRLQGLIDSRMASLDVNDPGRASLAFYRNNGLLTTRVYADPVGVQYLVEVPQAGNPERWISGPSIQNAIFPFEVDLALLPLDEKEALTAMPIFVRLDMGFRVSKAAADVDSESPVVIPFLPGQDSGSGPPQVEVSVLRSDRFNLIGPASVNEGSPVRLPALGGTIDAQINPAALPAIAARSVDGAPAMIYVMVEPKGPGRYDYKFTTDSVLLVIRGPDGKSVGLRPSGDPVFRARSKARGEQLRGGPPGAAPLAVYSYDAGHTRPGQDLLVEIRASIEKDLADTDEYVPTEISFEIRDPKTGKVSPAVKAYPENHRPAFATIPSTDVPEGAFELLVRNTSPDQWVTITSRSVGLATDTHGFGYNLLKGLFILWLLSLLVIAVAFFCSTFLSWPIAFVLTVLILLGHWGVNQLGDALSPGLGRSIADQMGMRDAAASQVVSSSVDALNNMLKTVSSVLPDISRFGVAELVERGVSIPMFSVLEALGVLLVFGVILIVAAYVILDNKEVAP